MRSSNIEVPTDDESAPQEMPSPASRRLAVIVLLLVVMAGIADWFIRLETPEPPATLRRGGGNPPAADVSPASETEVEWNHEPSAGHDTLRTSAEYIAEAAAICDTVTGRFRAAVSGLPVNGLSYPDELAALYGAAIGYSEKALVKLSALPMPKMEGQRDRFSRFYSLLGRQIDVLRQVAAAVSADHTARAQRLQGELIDLIHLKDGREPLLQSCPVAIGG